jgi:NTP pyrophosphatase (non-canonical NTP hydrolase)
MTNQTFSDYQLACLRTTDSSRSQHDRMVIATLGLVGEAGEFADALKKQIGHGHSADHAVLRAELGDVLFYVAELCNVMGWSMAQVAQEQVLKSLLRYPEGFSCEASLNRVDVEREDA